MSRRALIAVAAASAVLLALLGTLGVALATRDDGADRADGGDGVQWQAMPHGRTRLDPACAASPSGPAVTFVARDMGGMGWGRRDRSALGPMMLMPRTATASAGRVTVVLVNAGVRPHELVVLPLAAGQSAGQRSVGADDTVGEQGALGEAEAVCRVGDEPERVGPGGSGQVTLDLKPGRYEVVCNLPGHYRAGMYAILTVA